MIELTNRSSFDAKFKIEERLPTKFCVSFNEVGTISSPRVLVKMNQNQVGDVITDNSHKQDYYRYHDIFHYTFATLLGWSPCTRALMKRKRKSDPIFDEVEDGARAAITEEAISMIIFNEAKRKDFFKDAHRVSRITLRIIKEMTENFEVKIRTEKEWENAILQSYKVFRMLIENKGGEVSFDMIQKKVDFKELAN